MWTCHGERDQGKATEMIDIIIIILHVHCLWFIIINVQKCLRKQSLISYISFSLAATCMYMYISVQRKT